MTITSRNASNMVKQEVPGQTPGPRVIDREPARDRENGVHDRIHNVFQALRPGLDIVLIGVLVLVPPNQSILHRLLNFVLVSVLDVSTRAIRLHGVEGSGAIVLNATLRVHVAQVR